MVPMRSGQERGHSGPALLSALAHLGVGLLIMLAMSPQGSRRQAVSGKPVAIDMVFVSAAEGEPAVAPGLSAAPLPEADLPAEAVTSPPASVQMPAPEQPPPAAARAAPPALAPDISLQEFAAMTRPEAASPALGETPPMPSAEMRPAEPAPPQVTSAPDVPLGEHAPPMPAEPPRALPSQPAPPPVEAAQPSRPAEARPAPVRTQPRAAPRPAPARAPSLAQGPVGSATATAISAMPGTAAAGSPVASLIAIGPPLITSPRFRRAPQPPDYPARAIELDLTGTVVIRALLNPEGDPREVRVHRSSGQNILDSAAVSAVRRWAFEPASRDGQRVEAWVEVPVHFRLN